MKCIKTNNGEVKRVSDQEAFDKVRAGKAVYISKKEWKTKK